VLIESYVNFAQEYKEYFVDTYTLLEKATKQGKKILYEGAQGVMLDINYGSYPYVTSSSTTVNGIFSGAYPSPQIKEVLGIVKAYTTRVGAGQFPTKMPKQYDEYVRTIGHEYGATTGRNRLCGWLDLALLRYAVVAEGLTALSLPWSGVTLSQCMKTLKVVLTPKICSPGPVNTHVGFLQK
jgi:adenylosuccinate synthase